jgi:photosystem II stability/assembly factor-like uncharacterized protein
MRRSVAVLVLGMLAVALLCLGATETLTNRSGGTVSGVVLTFSEPVRVTSYDEAAFPNQEPSGREARFTFSGGVLANGARFRVSWSPSSATLASFDWMEAGGSAPSSLQTPPPASDAPAWVQTNGPFGGVINAIEMHPSDPRILYAGGLGGSVFRSEDEGSTWQALPSLAAPSEVISDILIPSGTPNRIYVHAAGGLYRSEDGGQTWRKTGEFGGVSCVAMAPIPQDTLAVGCADGRVYLTTDGGGHWSQIGSGLPQVLIRDIAFANESELWAGTAGQTGGVLYRTMNRGKTWTPIDLPQRADTSIRSILVDPATEGTVYVGLEDIHGEMFRAEEDGYFLKTADSGETWSSLHLPRTDAMVNVMWKSATNGTLYVGCGGGAYKSLDSGRTWTGITPPGRNGDMSDIALDPRSPDTLYLPRQRSGIVKSTNGGLTWTPVNAGLNNVSICLLAASPTEDDTVFATARSGEGTFKTVDSGATWTYVKEGQITHPWADELVVNSHDSQEVWEVADVQEVFRSQDAGVSWTKIIDTYGRGFRFGSVYALAPARSNPLVIYATKNGYGMFKSEDGGQSWRFLHNSEIDYTYTLAVHPANSNILYSGYNPKPFQNWAMVRQSADGGETWRTALTVPGSSRITSVTIDTSNPQTVYAGSCGSRGEIYKTSDAGNAWSLLNEAFTMCTVWGQPQLVVDPTSPSTCFVTTWLAGTWKTTDAGRTWTLLQDAPVSGTALSIDPLDPRVVYLSDRTAPKVWMTTDGGLAWSEIADFSRDGAFLVNRVFAGENCVYVATFGPTIHGGKLYRSTDRGATWGDITGSLPRSVLDIAVDPMSQTTLYVTTHIHGAFKSVDGGSTWSALTGFPDIGAYDIEADPHNAGTIYACGLGGKVPEWCFGPDGYEFADSPGVYKSTDGGESWVRVLATSNECRAVRLDPIRPNTVYAAAMDDGLQVSRDGGKTWTSYNTGLDTRVLTSCAVGGERIYVGTQGCGVYSGDVSRSSGAVQWSPERSNKPVPTVHSLQIQVDPSNPSRIFVGANPGGLYRSDDAGRTFYDKNFLTPSVVVDDPVHQGYYTFALNPTNPAEVWVGTWGKGVYKSYDGMDFDVDASGADRMMFGKHVYQLLVTSGANAAVYAATEEGVFVTRDSGATWVPANTGLSTSQVRTLAITSAGRLLAGTLGYELYSAHSFGPLQWDQVNAFGQFGTYWPIWNNRPLYPYTALLFHPDDPNVIYAGTFPSGIYKSLDKGKTWFESNVGWTNDGVFCMVFKPGDADVIYAGTYNGINLSTDGGIHWRKQDAGWPGEQWVFCISFDPTDVNTMYACSKNGENEGTGREGFRGTVMKSLDGGASWFAITNGLNLNQEFYRILVDTKIPRVIYLATQYEGVFCSRDSGGHWEPWNTGLFNPVAGTNGNNVANTLVLSASGTSLYFGSAGSGVFRRATLGAGG